MWPLITGHTHEKMKQTFLEMLQFVKERRSNVSRECAACNPPTYNGVLDLHDFWGQRKSLEIKTNCCKDCFYTISSIIILV